MTSDNLISMLSAYLPHDDHEASMQAQTLKFIQAHPMTCADRTQLDGHLTASAWVLDRDRRFVLLTEHRKLQRWLQLGGHADGEFDLQQVAMREAKEESGLTHIVPGSLLPFDIDVHIIPEKPEVPSHLHYDVRFWFIADITEPLTMSDESTDLKWVSIPTLSRTSVNDLSLQRLVLKTDSLK